MASVSESQVELINSLAPDDIPHKLRCAICSKLAVNAFRLPCCEQAICETCQSSLPQSCPVCEHSPLSAEDCNPNKSLRTTIRVFLRTAEKKRETSKPKEAKDSAPDTPVDAPKSLPPGDAPEPAEKQAPSREEAADDKGEQVDGIQKESKQDETTKDGEEATQGEDSATGTVANASGGGGGEGVDAVESREPYAGEGDDDDQAGGNDQEQYNADVANGGYPNMMFPGSVDFNQMSMMMAMQNGMGSNGFGGFPMMGMPGMGMDPMQMQNMFINGGFPGMGMNGMGGFGGGYGQGSNDDWNGSQSWNFDQNTYNQNGPSIGTGDFGNYNSGFQTGYNQGNYGHFNDYRRGFGRGRGRGRGYHNGYGRGGYQQGGINGYQDAAAPFAQYGQGQGQGQAFPAAGDGTQEGIPEGGVQTDEPGSVQGEADQVKRSTEAGGGGGEAEGGDGNPPSHDSPGGLDPSANGTNGESGGGVAAIRSILAPDVPINAPKGPRAMRQGLPNTSLLNLRARGFPVEDISAAAQTPAVPTPPPVNNIEAVTTQPGSRSSTPDVEGRQRRDKDREGPVGERGRERSRDRDSYGHRDRTRSRSGSRASSARSRSRSRGHGGSSRRRRPQNGDKDDSHRHRRRRRRSRRDQAYREDDGSPSASRSLSPEQRGSHHSRWDKEAKEWDSRRDKEKEKDKEWDRRRHHDEDDGGGGRRRRDYEHSSSSRRHDRERERRRHRERDGGRDRDRERRSRDPDGERQLGGRDAHTVEREARNRERLLKEAQRMAGLTGLAGSKRGRDKDDEGRQGRRSRRSEMNGDDEERMRRLEAEREGGRWG